MSAVDKAREDVMWGIHTLVERGYTCATGGNISALVEGEKTFVITPSGREYDTMTKDDLCVVDMEGKLVEGKYKPSFETPVHRLFFVNRPDVKAVIHMHSKFAMAAASLEGMDGIPPFCFEMLAYFGGPIPFAPFMMSGNLEFAEVVQEKIGKSMGIVLGNHGAIGVGATMKEAMTKCDLIERSCEGYLMILSAGKLKPIPPEVYEKVNH